MCAKLGLPDAQEGDQALIENTFRLLWPTRWTTRSLAPVVATSPRKSGHEPVRDLFSTWNRLLMLQYSEL
jgi:uncharacterized protein YdiU (UPF0061 family)